MQLVDRTPDVFSFISVVSFRARTSQEVVTNTTDEICSALENIIAMSKTDADAGKQMLEGLRGLDGPIPVDIAEELTSNLLAGQEMLEDAISALRECEDDAFCTTDLYGKNQDRVVDTVRRAIRDLTALAALTQEARWLVMEQAADNEVVPGEPMTADELLAALG